MKFKGKIVQIIKEENNKNYGLPKLPNTDWLNIKNQELINEEKKTRYKYNIYLFIFAFILMGIGVVLDLFLKAKWGGFLALIGLCIFILLIFNTPKAKNIWYFDAPIPVVKPHNYSINNEVEIDLEIKNA